MSSAEEPEAKIVRFPGIASISLSITPTNNKEDPELLEAIVKVYDENDEQIMRQKARSLKTIAKNLKLFIQTRTGLPINDRRMATWFSDYLGGLDVPLDSEIAYAIIKEASQALEKVSKVSLDLVEPTDLVSIETDVLANIISLTIDHILSEDELAQILETHQCPVFNKAKRLISFDNSEGKTHTDTMELQISPKEKVCEYQLIATFKNETQKPLENIIISDIIPFAYKVTDVTFEEAGMPEKELLQEGLKVSWTIPRIPAGEGRTARYSLERRIPRTIFIRKDNDIKIIQDYNSLRIKENEEGKKQKYFFSELISLLPVTLDEVFIRDLLPTELELTEASMTDDLTLIDFGNIMGTNIQWSQTNVETGTKLLKEFHIKSAPFLWKFDLKVPLPKKKQEIILTKFVEPLPNGEGYVSSIVGVSPVPCTIVNPIEPGIKILEYLPPDLQPKNVNGELKWAFEHKLEVSMILSGKITNPLAPKVIIDGKEYSASQMGEGAIRKSKVLAIPFNHVALYRKAVRR
ncbi:MAG: hypothetical protein GF308_12705 [Candidatus Heimdallarchaeota archaeon]|nr:hypothetical protein [Candidatus Heimdallarchaeota archaeon]